MVKICRPGDQSDVWFVICSGKSDPASRRGRLAGFVRWTSRSRMGNISIVWSDRGFDCMIGPPRGHGGFCLAAVRQTLAKAQEGRVSQHTLGATSRSGLSACQAARVARDRDLDAQKPAVRPRYEYRCHSLLIGCL
jgi:hypothetical protein